MQYTVTVKWDLGTDSKTIVAAVKSLQQFVTGQLLSMEWVLPSGEKIPYKGASAYVLSSIYPEAFKIVYKK